MPYLLNHFRSVPPKFITPQDQTFQWLAKAHERANAAEGPSRPRQRIERSLERFGCDSGRISRRGHELEDFTHEEWEKMRIFNFVKHPRTGAGMGARNNFYLEKSESIFDAFYSAGDGEPGSPAAPDELLHVTCTGYNMPSAAQRLVNRKRWNECTSVTHVYHMGCLAAIPALRMASGSMARGEKINHRVDIAHMELCTLHLNPLSSEPKDLVAQSLFADGMIAYSMSRETENPKTDLDSLRVLSILDRMIPDTLDAMTWMPEDWGMRMHLDRDIPQRIAGELPRFVSDLYTRAGLRGGHRGHESIFAVHPGGPKIIDGAQGILEITPEQVADSQAVLFERGNMSSATLPHIWARILGNREIPNGTLVASLAFGPGLTICGALLQIQRFQS